MDAKLKGDITISFNEFDTTEIDEAKAKYAEEVKECWRNTDVYAQGQKKTAKYMKEDRNRINGEWEELQKQFTACIGENPFSEKI